MRSRRIFEFLYYYVYTKAGIIIIVGIFLLTLGFVANDARLIDSGGIFVFFGVIAAIIHLGQMSAWKNIEKRHEENQNKK